jgi:hypothetical protein
MLRMRCDAEYFVFFVADHFFSIDGHRHRDGCHRHRHFGIHLSLVLEHSGTGLGLLILVLESRHRYFFSFPNRTDQLQVNRVQRSSEGAV